MKLILFFIFILPLELYSMEKMGEGIRKKKVAFFKVDVYKAQFFLSDKKQFKQAPGNPIDKILMQKEVEFRMKMLRDVDQDKIIASFKDAFETNQFKLDTPAMKQFFSHLDKLKEVQEGQTFIFKSIALNDVEVTFPDGKSERLIFDDMRKIIFSIWFGVPADNEIQEMANAILTH